MDTFNWVVDRAKFESAVKDCLEAGSKKPSEAEIKAAYIKRLGLVRGDPSTASGIPTRKVVREVEIDVNATKAAIKLAEEKGLDLTKVKGTGEGKTITVEDVKNEISG